MFDIDINSIPDEPKGLPLGEHVLVVAEAELKETKEGNGLYIKVEFQTDTGRKHWEMFNIKNKNPEAERIGKSQLKQFLKAAGYTGTNLNDVNALLGLRVLAKMKVKKDTGYGEGTTIASYKPAAADAMKGNDPFA